MIYANPQSFTYPKDASVTDVLFNFNLNGTPADKPAIIDGPSGDVVFTFESFRTSVKRVAQHFRNELKIAPGTVVGILSTNKVFSTYMNVAPPMVAS